MAPTRRRLAVIGAVVVAVAASSAATAGAAAPTQFAPRIDLVAQARPGECYGGVEQPILDIRRGRCPFGYQPRVTESYAWGSTVASDGNIWFGTLSSALCANLLAYQSAFAKVGVDFPVPFRTADVACDFDGGAGRPSSGVSGDVRTTRLYEFDSRWGRLIDRSPSALTSHDFQNMAGIRAVGELNNVVIAAGLPLSVGDGRSAGGGVILVAFDATTGRFLGSRTYPKWNDVKNFINYKGSMYFGVGLTPADPDADPPIPAHPRCACRYGTQGQVVRFSPSPRRPLPSPDSIVSVGNLGQTPAYFEIVNNRLAATTYLNTPGEPAAVYLSPPLRPQLTSGDATHWTHLLTADQFLPDPVTAGQALGFGIKQYEGQLYFVLGMYPGQSTLAHIAAHTTSFPRTLAALGQWFRGSEPAAMVFRVADPGTSKQRIQLLYGEASYPVLANGRWSKQPNKLHLKPLYGPGGFGNAHNPYGAWGIATFAGKLYLGGFDSSKILRDVLFDPASGWVEAILGKPVPDDALRALGRTIAPDTTAAGPVWYFPNGHSPAQPLTTNGFGNQDNWGVRGLWPVTANVMFLGTNNGFNFYQPGVSPPRQPGWQIYRLIS